ncbi:hypothetical protein HYN48_08435 [Flavobacterium magnum]|uniref:Uncharacterized protein n=2 Tax=Flavobacterium magnum TaxID=2162713 RepID=A0A2S0RHA1_9FLAO|nr:hypothetical protein HYN48_08435 [Flavobacterium magnum]
MAFFAFGYASAQTDTTATRKMPDTKKSEQPRTNADMKGGTKKEDSVVDERKRRMRQDKGMAKDSVAVPPRKRNK